jgi:ABC-type polysaccharide/polyol phosphate transport system ATPase subunit
MSEKLVVVEGLSKKYCTDLKKSLYYGLLDMGAEMRGSRRSNVSLRKGEFWALDDVSFEVKKGEIMGLIGPNGSGKTTVLRLLSGLIKPDRGCITIRGRIQALIALGAGFNPVLTGRENIYVNGAILGFSKAEINSLLESIVAFSELEQFLDAPVQSYSSGMQVRLGFAIATNLRPDILLVDEVLAVGDAPFRRKARKKMMELLHSGVSVILVSHNIPLISSITSKCIYLNGGKVIEIGDSDQVTARYLNYSISRELDGYRVFGKNCMAAAYHTTPFFNLNRVTLMNCSGVLTDSFRTGENIHIAFEVEVIGGPYKLNYAMCIRDKADDATIAFHKLPQVVESKESQIRLECSIRDNFLREGVYDVGFFVADAHMGSIFKSNLAGTFRILSGAGSISSYGSTSGYVVIDAEWTLVNT